jgi:hypothetical protein
VAATGILDRATMRGLPDAQEVIGTAEKKPLATRVFTRPASRLVPGNVLQKALGCLPSSALLCSRARPSLRRSPAEPVDSLFPPLNFLGSTLKRQGTNVSGWRPSEGGAAACLQGRFLQVRTIASMILTEVSWLSPRLDEWLQTAVS